MLINLSEIVAITSVTAMGCTSVSTFTGRKSFETGRQELWWKFYTGAELYTVYIAGDIYQLIIPLLGVLYCQIISYTQLSTRCDTCMYTGT